MGRPIQRKWFGDTTLPGSQIVVNGIKWADGTTSLNGYIVRQKGVNAYIVSNGVKEEICFLANASTVSALAVGQCFILATPFGGSARPCFKIEQYRLSIFAADGTIDSYTWSTIPADGPGQADLITGAGAVGSILTLVLDTPGFGYFTAPTVAFTGGGSGAAGSATVANGVVTALTVDTAGSGYASGGVTLSAPPASVTATATAVVGSGIITGATIVLAGGYYTTAPLVTITDSAGVDADITATIADGIVTGLVINDGGTGYVEPVITIAAPAAAVQATAHATISV